MPRTYHKKGIHTCPENAGVKNMPEDLPKDESGIMDKIMPCMEHGLELKKDYSGAWTDDLLLTEVRLFFKYCKDCDFKPTQPLLELWLGVSRTQFYDWRTKSEKYGEKSNIIGWAMRVMESYLQANIEKYPTGSTFILKTTHGHIESSKLDITSNGKALSGNAEEVNDLVSKLGLDKE